MTFFLNIDIFSKIQKQIKLLIRCYKKNKNYLIPIDSIESRSLFKNMQKSESIKKDKLFCQFLINKCNTNTFTVDGFCIPCNRKSKFLIDSQFGGKFKNGVLIPNWRERMECQYCHMNNRQRLIAALIIQKAANKKLSIYFMEQVTPIFQWAQNFLGNKHRIVGSEYLGYEYKGGDIIEGIRHENIEDLSFRDEEFELIISNDVFEHVPNADIAFNECSRILKTGGQMLATIPFYDDQDQSVKRATLENNYIKHILEPQYHGNPLSSEGSLVFNDFGWDILTTIRKNGFANSYIDIFLSKKYGHIGGPQLIFQLNK